MGWASGSYVMSDIIKGLRPLIPDDKLREHIYAVLIDALEGADWDTQSECVGEDPAYDAALGYEDEE